MTRDDAVVEVVGAILVLAAIVLFVALASASWLPVWTADREAGRADLVRAAVEDWAADADAHAVRALEDRTFSRSVPLGDAGLPLLGIGATGGRLTVEAGPTAALYSAATEVATASGSLAASTDSLRFPQQTFRDSLGALEVRQGEGTWVDLRGLLSASRADGGNVALAFRFQSLAGAPQVVAANGRVDALGALRAVDDAVAPDAAYARLVVTDIPADAWRAASTRTLEAAALVGDTRVDCATTTLDWCLDAATNDASTLDLWILDPAAGWTASVATFDVEVRT